ncbi:helicase associated domain-containing protein [Actinacidiphila oryziradicis]|uniref:Helicase-associated domain-containing protein n=1 Tax=Actinacidiphila oryziradicis TaxID=2571141 RepID=A0A4U0SCQ5_9ACTN|nr:helicase associated domain-containing protein [Actinacidiphila oryziradicis]TKA06388.1 hypothetical protein FCI23_31895 [Actinacidiphila oryziradicis]
MLDVHRPAAYRSDHGDLRVPYDYRSPAPDGSDADGFPLGMWIAEQRRAPRTGRLATDRVKERTRWRHSGRVMPSSCMAVEGGPPSERSVL